MNYLEFEPAKFPARSDLRTGFEMTYPLPF